ncbi:MAG: glycoside hydrolase family 88 protein [Bryobacteraceae bacterium]|nr:glycosyl hydrolase [Bryobacterales bacterium]NUN02283.1 glycoside hydrolase family 88 protein [Bryobacteraceae bacterium]
MIIDTNLTVPALESGIRRLFEAAAVKIRSIEASSNPSGGSPVFTSGGRYTSRGWTEWTQGFQFGCAILEFDATGEQAFLDIGRQRTVDIMAPHITHTGVHDHGFNNVSTYGNLLRLMQEGRIESNPWERRFYELALKCSGAVQASRWTNIKDGGGYIYSFNGPHSLFVDTMRTIRALAVSHRLGHALLAENDRRVSLLDRLIHHAHATARYSVYYGEGRDAYDIRGRVAHESIFNTNDGNYRCPNSQQGYSPFTTWTRGLAWAMCGFAEQLEFVATVDDEELAPHGGRRPVEAFMRKAAEAVCDFYIDDATASDGLPYWDTGAPGLANLKDWRSRPSDPFNDHEPVDSSAAVIAAQGLLRLGRYLENDRYWKAGLTVCRTLFAEPYLSTDPNHQGLILHSIYHRPNGWDRIPDGRKIPSAEACMWGDYHAMELALYVQRILTNKPYYKFWSETQ